MIPHDVVVISCIIALLSCLFKHNLLHAANKS